MNVPTYLPLLAVTTLGDETSVTLGLVGTIVVVALALGESRWQVAHLREWKHSAEAELAAVTARVTSLEVREGRTLERLDSFADRLSRIEEKIDRLLERHAA